MKRVGIIGCGNIAGLNELDSYREKPCTHMGGYQTRKDVEVVGCCDVSPKKAKEFADIFKIPFYTSSINELLDQQIDILSICVPYKLNHKVVAQVVRHNKKPKTIFLEKPISYNLQNAVKIVQLCKDNKIKLFVNNRRVSDFYQGLKNVVKKELDNEILNVNAWCSSGMHTIGIHMVDLLRDICGNVKTVYAIKESKDVKFLPYSHNYTPDDPRYNATLVFNNNINATLANTAQTDFTYFEVELLCKKGRVRASDNGKKLVIAKKGKPGTSTLSYRLDKEKEIKLTSKPLFKKLIDEVMSGKATGSPISGDEALKSYALIDAMRRSARLKQPVKV